MELKKKCRNFEVMLVILLCSSVSTFSQDLNDLTIKDAVQSCLEEDGTGNCNMDDYGSIDTWDTSNVTDMSNLFNGASAFNQDISGWDTSKVTNMSKMFLGAAAFNQDINGWDTSNVEDMSKMFTGATVFDKDISGWETEKVTDMSYMFSGADKFNQDINQWNTSQVTDMSYMFFVAKNFNGNIITWNTSNVTDMSHMFYLNTTFNRDISGWQTEKVTDMKHMFNGATEFNKAIGNWNIGAIQSMNNMLDNCGLNPSNLDLTLYGWADSDSENITNPSIPQNITLGLEGLEYCNVKSKSILIAKHKWDIVGGGESDNCDETLGTKNKSEWSTTISPNPTADKIILTGISADIKKVIYDIHGTIVKEATGNTIDLSTLKKGIYIVQVADGAKTTAYKIVKN